MKTSGYALREAIKQHELRRDTAAKLFNTSLKTFPGEKKDETPQALVTRFLNAETAIALLQTAQAKYNLRVTFDVLSPSTRMTLSEAIKRIGGIARVEKMWRSAAGPGKESLYADHDVRDPTQVRSTPTISINEIVKLATQAGKQAGQLRAAIATANAREVEIEDLEPSLFE